MKTQTSYKVASIALLAIFVTMITPSTAFSTSDSTALTMYGMADIVQKDGAGDVVFTQTVHNAITDEGEAFVLNQIFTDGSDPAAATNTIGSICLTDNTLDITATNSKEDLNAADVEDHPDPTDDTVTIIGNLKNTYGVFAVDCISSDTTDTTLVVSSGSGLAQIGPFTFEAGAVLTGTTNNIPADGSINAILICENGSDKTCTGTLFAVVDQNPALTIADGSSVTITYNFDISSDSS